MNLEGTIQVAAFNRSLDRLNYYSKRDGKTLLREQARGFVKLAVGITPPSQGKANPASRKRGEAAVKADLRRIMTPKPRPWLEHVQQVIGGTRAEAQVLRRADGTPYLIDYDEILWSRGELVQWHEQRRRPSDGRVKRTNRHVTTGRKSTDSADMGFVPKDNFKWYEKRVVERVGLLAGGWNAAAAELGVRGIPQWITRHGTGRGDITVQTDGPAMRITIANDVKFSNTARGFRGRILKALTYQAKAMDRRVDKYLERIAQQSGLA